MARDLRPDRPSLDPEFVASQTFSSSFRGFDTTEVRAYLEVIADLLREGDAREEVLTTKLADAEERLAHPPPLDEDELTALLGAETARVIGTARQAAIDIRSKSEENAARLVREAIDEAAAVRSAAEEHATRLLAELELEAATQRAAADEYVSATRGSADEAIARERAEAESDAQRMLAEAEAILGVRTEEAERAAAVVRAEAEILRGEAAAEVESLRSVAAEETAAQRADATAEAAAAIEAARQQGRGMVDEARAVRERMLTDLVERRRLGRAHLDQLRGTREWMLEVLESARARIDEAAGDLAAPLASDRVIEDRAPQDAEDDALLEAMMTEEPAELVELVASAPPAPNPAPQPEAAAVVESAALVEPPAEVGGPPPDEPDTASIDALFAKLRAARTDGVERAEEVLDLTGPEPTSRVDTGSGPGLVATAADAEAPDPLATLLERRDAATDAIERQLGRRLKRILSDEQNELLDQVRRTKGVPEADAILPLLADHQGRYADAAADDLAGAVAAGAKFNGGGTAKVATKVDDIAERLAEELVRQLRGRLTRCFSDASGDEVELGERIRACYREWKTQRIADTSRHFVLAAFTRGLFDAAPPGSAFRWIVDDGGTPCPDAEDNALQGQVAKGDPFPTGDIYPPAHPGCRCLIVPVEVAVISPS